MRGRLTDTSLDHLAYVWGLAAAAIGEERVRALLKIPAIGLPKAAAAERRRRH